MRSGWLLLQTDEGRAGDVVGALRLATEVVSAEVVCGAYDVVAAVAGDVRRASAVALRLPGVRRTVVCQPSPVAPEPATGAAPRLGVPVAAVRRPVRRSRCGPALADGVQRRSVAGRGPPNASSRASASRVCRVRRIVDSHGTTAPPRDRPASRRRRRRPTRRSRRTNGPRPAPRTPPLPRSQGSVSHSAPLARVRHLAQHRQHVGALIDQRLPQGRKVADGRVDP